MTKASVGSRIVFAGLLAISAGLAMAAVRAWMIGVPAYDPWLFPMLVVLPALASVAFALSLRLAPATRANIALLTAAIVFGLYAIEAVLQIMPQRSDPLPAELAAADGREFDTRSRFEVVAALRAAGTKAFPSFGARGLRVPGIVIDERRVAPLAQLTNTVIVDCNEGGQFSVFHTDERGFNNPQGSWQRPIAVAAVGDSYIQGSCVDPADNLVAGIRKSVPGTVGLGLGDSGPLVMLGMIKEYLTDVRPPDVFWFFYEGNDLRNLRAELRVPELRQYIESEETQGLREIQSRIDSMLVPFVEDLLKEPVNEEPPADGAVSAAVRMRRWTRLFRLRSALGLADIGSRLQECCDPDELAAVLAEADRTVRGWGGRLHFVYLPAAGRYAHPMAALLDDDLRQRRMVLRIVRRTGLPVIDMHNVFKATGDPEALVFNARSHFNPAGYRVAADAVVDYLSEMNR